jgi:hypothetical protein
MKNYLSPLGKVNAGISWWYLGRTCGLHVYSGIKHFTDILKLLKWESLRK